MQTPEEFLGALEMAYADANRDRDACPSGTRIIINRGAQAAAGLIRARDAEVAEAARAEALAGFAEERAKFWEHDEGTGRLRRATTGVVCTRLVGPWEPVGGEQS